jgi:beta-lactamase regulating signal transducer with metallopeptidase domain
MSTLVELGLVNALSATLLAVAVWLVTRVWRRAEVAWFLWLLVLAKLLTPPLVLIPWPEAWLAGAWPQESAPTTEPSAVVELAMVERSDALRPFAMPASSYAEAPRALTTQRLAPAIEIPLGVKELAHPESIRQPLAESISLIAALGWIWLAGSLTWLTIAAVRLTRFARLVRQAEEAPQGLVAEVRAIEGRLRMRRSVRVVMVRRNISPMMWRFLARPTLVLPAELMHMLSSEARATLFAHELAHAVRPLAAQWLELAALAAYWWHPVAWWARRQLEQAEERCCDASVVELFPALTRTYAETLVATLDFAAGDAGPVPLGFRAFSQQRHITRRIEMILSGGNQQRLTRRWRLALWALALGAMPWSVGRATAAPSSAISLIVGSDLTGADIKTLEQRLDRLEKMVQTLTAEVQAMRKDQTADAPPVVIRTIPATGAKDVDPDLKEIKVTFSKDMQDGRWSWTQRSDDTFPESTGKIHYEKDNRTCVMPVKLAPGKTYWIGLNWGKFTGFADPAGQTAKPYRLSFTTKSE